MIFTHTDYMAEGELESIFNQLSADRAVSRTVWYEGEYQSFDAFQEYLSDCWFVRVSNELSETVGAFWLNGIVGRSAQIHFAILGKYHRDAVNIGRETLHWIEQHRWFHSVYGITPYPYRHAIDYIKALGFEVKGRLPGACFLKRRGAYIDGVISIYKFNEVG